MLAFLPLLPILVLLLTALAILLVRLARPGFAYSWLIAAFGALLTWPMTLLLRRTLPHQIQLVSWQAEGIFTASPALLVDALSWPFALALATLVLGVILTDVARSAETDWTAWIGSLSLSALGMLAVFSGNPLTLLLTWAALDLVELLVLLNRAEEARESERVIIAFSARVAGILLLVAGMIAARAGGSELAFDSIPNTASIFLLLASGFRLGVIPLQLPLMPDLRLRHGLGTISRLAPAAASLVLLARTATAGVPDHLELLLLAASGLAALYAGFSWVIARDELEGRPFWMLGMASLALGAAVRGQPEASLAWGIAMLLPGSLLFLLSSRHRLLIPLALAGFFALTAFPFTPTWPGGRLYVAPINAWLILFLAAQVLLLMGFLRHSLRPGEGLAGVERWVYVIYPIGLLLIPVAHYVIGWWGFQGPGSITFGALLPGLLSLGLMGLGILVWQNIPDVPSGLQSRIKSVLSLQWLYRLLWGTYRTAGRLFGFISTVMEGEGGILWTLLLLTLLLAFVLQGRPGG